MGSWLVASGNRTDLVTLPSHKPQAAGHITLAHVPVVVAVDRLRVVDLSGMAA
jgi:hypothetical protein